MTYSQFKDLKTGKTYYKDGDAVLKFNKDDFIKSLRSRCIDYQYKQKYINKELFIRHVTFTDDDTETEILRSIDIAEVERKIPLNSNLTVINNDSCITYFINTLGWSEEYIFPKVD